MSPRMKALREMKVTLPAWVLGLLLTGGGGSAVVARFWGGEEEGKAGVSAKDAVQDEQIRILQEGQKSMNDKLDKILERLPARESGR